MLPEAYTLTCNIDIACVCMCFPSQVLFSKTFSFLLFIYQLAVSLTLSNQRGKGVLARCQLVGSRDVFLRNTNYVRAGGGGWVGEAAPAMEIM